MSVSYKLIDSRGECVDIQTFASCYAEIKYFNYIKFVVLYIFTFKLARNIRDEYLNFVEDITKIGAIVKEFTKEEYDSIEKTAGEFPYYWGDGCIKVKVDLSGRVYKNRLVYLNLFRFLQERQEIVERFVLHSIKDGMTLDEKFEAFKLSMYMDGYDDGEESLYWYSHTAHMGIDPEGMVKNTVSLKEFVSRLEERRTDNKFKTLSYLTK